jgi:polysaccharide pyruvyl transferase WcaK-like protein
LVGDRGHIKMYPDFTNITDGIVPEYFSTEKPRACLIPNAQMIAKTSDTVGESYIPFFANCARYLEKADLNPFILLHDVSKDRNLADEIRKTSNIPLEIIEDENPLHLKGIIGKCHLMVGSRFHALISALSQAVPAIATGWSHKYEHLFKGYGCPEFLISNLDFEAEALQKLQMLSDSKYRDMIVKTLTESSQVEKQKTEKMWQDVYEVVSRRS